MTIEKQVCSLEQSKKLKELGVLQGTYWIYREGKAYPENMPVLITSGQLPTGIDAHAFNLYSAYTVAELGVMIKGSMYLPVYMFAQSGKGYWHATGSGRYETEAQARAGVLIWLLANEVMNITEVNQRLLDN